MMKYIKYKILLKEPVRIADDSSAKQGQAMTRRYIPGTTVRGCVINRLASKGYLPDGSFSAIKKELFSDRIRFLNAYLTIKDQRDKGDAGDEIDAGVKGKDLVLLPSPKGFYEDKSRRKDRKELQNVTVKGEFDESFKRAKIGTNVYIEFPDESAPDSSGGGTLHFYSPKVISDTKIKLGEKKDQNIFRSTSIQPGYRYTGYIALDDAEAPVPGAGGRTLADVIKSTLEGTLIIGNSRTSGLGKCLVETCTLTEEMPFSSYVIKEENGSKDCYMMLLSDTVMRDACGEYCGLDIPTLERILGVEKLKIEYCATTVTDARGFNRHYGGATPSAPMYEKGSVFHLSYEGTLDREHLDAVHSRGIGVRRNEGFGQVLFVRDYESIKFKLAGEDSLRPQSQPDKDSSGKEKTSKKADTSEKAEKAISGAVKHNEDEGVIEIVARSCYRNRISAAMQRYIIEELSLPDSTSSQLGNILSIAMKNRFTPEAGWKGINDYFAHKIQKDENGRVHSTAKKALSDPLYRKIKEIETTPLHELLKLQFINWEEAETGEKKVREEEKEKEKEKMVMGFPISGLLKDSEEKQAKLEFLIQIIRYKFKQEVKV